MYEHAAKQVEETRRQMCDTKSTEEVGNRGTTKQYNDKIHIKDCAYRMYDTNAEQKFKKKCPCFQDFSISYLIPQRECFVPQAKNQRIDPSLSNGHQTKGYISRCRSCGHRLYYWTLQRGGSLCAVCGSNSKHTRGMIAQHTSSIIGLQQQQQQAVVARAVLIVVCHALSLCPCTAQQYSIPGTRYHKIRYFHFSVRKLAQRSSVVPISDCCADDRTAAACKPVRGLGCSRRALPVLLVGGALLIASCGIELERKL